MHSLPRCSIQLPRTLNLVSVAIFFLDFLISRQSPDNHDYGKKSMIFFKNLTRPPLFFEHYSKRLMSSFPNILAKNFVGRSQIEPKSRFFQICQASKDIFLKSVIWISIINERCSTIYNYWENVLFNSRIQGEASQCLEICFKIWVLNFLPRSWIPCQDLSNYSCQKFKNNQDIGKKDDTLGDQSRKSPLFFV